MKILLLGSGELGKEFTIAAQRIGQTIIAVDSYENAPAMQVAHGFEVINMLDGEALDRIVAKQNLILLFLRLKPFVLNVLRLRKTRYYCSSF
jgi:formate-dependent phosphoribosylglycinamide formyltransferase (GAR transformylase)